MNMFDNYGNDSYPAYNLTCPKVSNVIERYFSSPIISYDKFGNINSFSWDPQDKFNLKLSLGVKVKVLSNSIIYDSKGVKPDKTTSGIKGQRAYNIIDGKSWVCQGTVAENTDSGEWIPLNGSEEEDLPEWIPLSKTKLRSYANLNIDQDSSESEENVHLDEYIWEEDNLFTFVDNGTKEILVAPDMTDKTFKVTFMNFRHEVIYSYDFENSANAEISIGPEVTSLLVEGQFFINTYIVTSDTVTQCSQYGLTIIEDPIKWIFNNYNNVKYIEQTTIQVDMSNAQYIWQPLGDDSNNDYVWIPITNNINSFTASWNPLGRRKRVSQ